MNGRVVDEHAEDLSSAAGVTAERSAAPSAVELQPAMSPSHLSKKPARPRWNAVQIPLAGPRPRRSGRTAPSRRRFRPGAGMTRAVTSAVALRRVVGVSAHCCERPSRQEPLTAAKEGDEASTSPLRGAGEGWERGAIIMRRKQGERAPAHEHHRPEVAAPALSRNDEREGQEGRARLLATRRAATMPPSAPRFGV